MLNKRIVCTLEINICKLKKIFLTYSVSCIFQYLKKFLKKTVLRNACTTSASICRARCGFVPAIIILIALDSFVKSVGHALLKTELTLQPLLVDTELKLTPNCYKLNSYLHPINYWNALKKGDIIRYFSL